MPQGSSAVRPINGLYLFLYINSTNIPPVMITNRIYESQNLLSLYLVSFLVGPKLGDVTVRYLFLKIFKSVIDLIFRTV